MELRSNADTICESNSGSLTLIHKQIRPALARACDSV